MLNCPHNEINTKPRNKQKHCLPCWHRLKVLKLHNVGEGRRIQEISYMVCTIQAILRALQSSVTLTFGNGALHCMKYIKIHIHPILSRILLILKY